MLEVSQAVAPDSALCAAGRGKSGLRRAGCWVTPRRYKPFARAATKARNRATETSRAVLVHTGNGAGETRQPPSGATPSKRTTTLLAESAGRWLERRGNAAPRRMTAIGRVSARPVTEPGLSADFDFICGDEWRPAASTAGRLHFESGRFRRTDSARAYWHTVPGATRSSRVITLVVSTPFNV